MSKVGEFSSRQQPEGSQRASRTDRWGEKVLGENVLGENVLGRG